MKKNKLLVLIALLLVVLSGFYYFKKSKPNKDFIVTKVANEITVTSPKYKNIIRTAEKNIFAYKGEKTYGLIFVNPDNTFKVVGELDMIGQLTQGLILVKKGKYGAIDFNGKLFIPTIYDEAYLGENKKAILKKDNIFMIFNSKNDRKKKSLEADSVYKVNNLKLIFIKNKKMGLMDFNGEVIIQNEYDGISSYIDKVFIGEKNLKYSIYNLKNEKLSKDYDYIEQVSNNVYKAGTNKIGKYAFLSSTFSSDEKYEDIIKIDNTYYTGRYLNEENVDLFNENGKIKSNLKKDEVKKHLEKLLKKSDLKKMK